MTTTQLPERPNIEQLKRQAKDLLNSANSADPAVRLASRTRFRAVPAFAARTDEELARIPVALHDAQSVIARELGLVSWNALREKIEELTLEFAQAVDEFVQAATDGRSARAERLLALHPRIARANFHTALVLGDAATVETRLAENPALATASGGPRGWEPLLYVCHCSLPARDTARAEGLAAIARRLIELGADPNARFPWLHHGVRRAVLWGATCVTHSLPLAKQLLESGANPNDGVTLTIAASGGDLPVLELLNAHGADANFPWATDGASPLYSILGWASTAVGARWLLEHGADPNRVGGNEGETAVHVAARKWDVPLMELLVHHGADIARRRADGRTPYAVAELNGNRAVADWLLAHGSPGELSEVDRFGAACGRGDRVAAGALLAARPALRTAIGPEHHLALRQAAERGDLRALETMLDFGFDLNATGDIGQTPLHCAAHNGQTEAVRLLLSRGASVSMRDREFHGQPLIWAADGARNSSAAKADFDAIARLLLDAGSPTEWKTGEEPSDAILEIIAEWRRT